MSKLSAGQYWLFFERIVIDQEGNRVGVYCFTQNFHQSGFPSVTWKAKGKPTQKKILNIQLRYFNSSSALLGALHVLEKTPKLHFLHKKQFLGPSCDFTAGLDMMGPSTRALKSDD